LKPPFSNYKDNTIQSGIYHIALKVLHILLWISATAVYSAGQTGADTLTVTDTLNGKGKIVNKSKDALESKITYKSKDSIFFDLKAKQVHLYGEAKIEYEGMMLVADYILMDFNKKEVSAKHGKDSSGKKMGIPVFTEGGKSYEADAMRYNFESKKGVSEGVITTEDDGFVYGEKVLKDSSGQIYVKSARYTTCDDPDPHFYISAKKFKIIPKKQVVTGPANLVVAGVRTPLVIPFGFFPIKSKQTKGILFPTYGETQDRGFFLRDFGYYTPISDYMDLAVLGTFYFRGSWGITARTNYKKRYRYNGNLTFSYNLNEFGEPESASYSESGDVNLHWTFMQDAKAKPGRSFNANVNYVSSNFYKNNSFQVNDIARSNINSSLGYNKTFRDGKINLGANGRMDQNVQTKTVNVSLPSLTLSASRYMPFEQRATSKQILKNFGLSYQGNMENRVQVQEENLFKASVIDSMNNGIRHSVPIGTSFKAFKYFSVNPSFNLNDYWYFKTLEKQWDTDNDTLLSFERTGFERAMQYSASISMSTIFYGTKTFKKGGIYAIRHVVRPQISAGWNPDYTKDSRFGYRQVQTDTAGTKSGYTIFDNGILGGPSGAASASLNFGIGNNLEMKIRSSKDTANGGIKKIKLIESFNVNGGYNFLADSLRLSVITMSGNTTLFERINLNFSGNLDPYSFDSVGTSYYRVNRSMLGDYRKLTRFTYGRLSMSTNLNPRANKKKTSEVGSETELEMINSRPYAYVDFNIPWSLSLNYNISYNKPWESKPEIDQSFTFNGDINLTERWKIALSSGYNFTLKELSLTKIDFFRNLHCWEFSFGWIPVGPRQSFDFTIRVKSPTLQDLKLNRRAFWFDN
jgi:lipopolysaccharide export system protein LptA